MSYNEKLEDRIDHYLITNEELIKNKRLGWVGWLLNGNMCFGIYSDLLIVRLSESLASSLIHKESINRFSQADPTHGCIISIGSTIYRHDRALFKFVDQSVKFTRNLPEKNADQWSNRLN